MIFSAKSATWSVCFALWKLNVAFPAGAGSIEEIVIRWVHIVAGILWVGFLSFFVLAGGPMLKSLDPGIRAKVLPELASRGLWWIRWSAMVGWLAGFRYFMILAKTDAVNAGRPHAWGGWIGIWFGCWLAAFAIEMVLIRAGEGALGSKFVVGALVERFLVRPVESKPPITMMIEITDANTGRSMKNFEIMGVSPASQCRSCLWLRSAQA